MVDVGRCSTTMVVDPEIIRYTSPKKKWLFFVTVAFAAEVGRADKKRATCPGLVIESKGR